MIENLRNVEKALEHNFLYESDADAMHILLSMLDHRHRYHNLKPSYRLMKRLNTALKRSLRDRKDRDYIILALRRLVNDDVNRFELSVVIDAYSKGYRSDYWVDQLERCALELYSPDELSRMRDLFQCTKQGKAMGLKSDLFYSLKENSRYFSDLKHLTSAYCRRVLRYKIYRLNENIDKQIVLDFEDLSRLRVEENNLTIRELHHIYNKCNQYLYNNVTKVYKDAFWNGVNDAVLERYAG